MSHQYLGFWLHSRRLTSLVVGVVFCLSAVPAYAQFKPRDRKPASGYSSAGGSRGCSTSGIPLTQLAPQTFIGKTASTRPMLAWYMSSSQRARFRLFEFLSAKTVKQIGKVKEISTTVGINKLKLPIDYPELTVGKIYFWQIAIDCEARPIVSNVEFTVINPQSLAKNRFSSIPESINYYAENELWYEAFEEALKATSNGKLVETGASLLQELAQSEIPTGSEVDIKIIKQRIEDIQRISSERI
ncbi:DUF928 domain-containing protein [Nostoc sp. 'Lobaria pulmonaria (5183) cyanobiont']|uniref:DUF928 domain-containing protein n=1 Tax=Nostoc sp. 'Lobaria pulmonaria (5183) cyanobiont' TaxID=1618022 RepID=UPI000CF32F25|nr:DUF928 domain-containing protein [Nostoc sp. 'Lobaria pulmonaria (5183) cyanobiont']AVH71094.1 protein of unknown function DUF928 [Nostoc sp. 'Lobaria pulmonaria (5183) cyanobiont']